MTRPTRAWSRPEPAVQASGNSCVSGGWLRRLMLIVGMNDRDTEATKRLYQKVRCHCK